MRFLTPAAGVLSLLCLTVSAAPPATTTLFNGHALTSWEFVTSPAAAIDTVCTVSTEGVIAAAGQPVGFIATKSSYENYRLHVEWRWPAKPGNGGVLVHISSGPKDRAWPECFQIQTKFKAVGDLLPMAGASFAEPLTSPPDASPQIRAHTAADSEKPAGKWNTCDITCRGDTIEVSINGVVQNKVTGASLQRGRIGFQFEGAPFELRNLTLSRLD